MVLTVADPAPVRRADPRLPAYVLAATVTVVAALATGRAELLVPAAPFAVLLVLASADPRPPIRSVTVSLARSRLVAGQSLDGTIEITPNGRARHDVLFVAGRGFRRHPGAPGAAGGLHLVTTGGRAATVPFRLDPRGWGRHAVGELQVRSRRTWALHTWDLVVRVAEEIRVVPDATRLTRLLDPSSAGGAAGIHRSPARGSGSDIAELRPYQPGDRLRDMSWAATARTGRPWVTEHHPERTGAVLLVVDTTGDGAGPGAVAFRRSAGACWSLASAHLRAGDRVGVLATGPVATWLPPAGGRRARAQLLDALLAVPTARRVGPQRARPVTHSLVPAGSLVIGVTMLQSDAFVASLARFRRHGRSTVAVVVDPTTDLPPTIDPVENVARRLWRAELEVRQATLAAAGVPSAVVTDVSSLPATIRALRRSASRPALRRRA